MAVGSVRVLPTQQMLITAEIKTQQHQEQHTKQNKNVIQETEQERVGGGKGQLLSQLSCVPQQRGEISMKEESATFILTTVKSLTIWEYGRQIITLWRLDSAKDAEML